MQQHPTSKEGDQSSMGNDPPRISETLSDFIEHLRVEYNRAPNTRELYRRHIQRLVDSSNDCTVTRIDGDTISTLKRGMLDSRCGPSTIGAVMSAVRSFLMYLRDARGFDVYEPTKVKRPKVPSREVEYLTPEERERFFEAIPTNTLSGLRDRALAEVLFATGMRISEATSLQHKQIDWDGREAQIIGKGNKQRRVYFSERSLEWLRTYLRNRHDRHPVLFVANGDAPRPIDTNGAWRRFHRYAELAGLGKKVYPHMFRHTLATTLLANGCPIGHIRVLLGHEHLTTTCKYYLGLISNKEAKRAHWKYLYGTPESLASADVGAAHDADNDGMQPAA